MPEFGTTAWARLWLVAFNAAAACDRLEIGRELASQSGAVVLDIAPGRVRATVPRSEPRPIRAAVSGRAAEVDLLVAALQEAGAEATDLATDRDLRARLAPLLSEVLATAPLEMGCSCPSWTRPCPHLAALALTFANEVDRDPLRLLDFAFRAFRALLAPKPAAPPPPPGVACGPFWLGGGSGVPPAVPLPVAARADFPLRITTPPPVKGKVSDFDLPAVMHEVCALLAGLTDPGDVEADIASVGFGLPSAAPPHPPEAPADPPAPRR